MARRLKSPALPAPEPVAAAAAAATPAREPLAALAQKLDALAATFAERIAAHPPVFTRDVPDLAETHAEFTCIVEPPALQIAFRPNAPQRTTHWWVNSRMATVTLPLVRWRADPLKPSCSCPAQVPCRHLPVALRAAADWLRSSPSLVPTHLVHFLAAPGWKRTLHLLDRGLANAQPRTRDPADVRLLSWRLSRSQPLGVPRIEPVLHKQLASGAWSKGASARLEDLFSHLSGHPADRAVAALLNDAAYVGQQFGRESSFHYAALEKLIGHPRVFVDKSDTPLRLRHARIELVLTPGENEALELRPTLDGDLATSDALLAERLHSHFVLIREGEALLAPVSTEAREVIAALAESDAHFPKEAQAELLERLHPLENTIPLRLPPALAGERVTPDARTCLRLRALAEGGLHVEVRVRPLEAGPLLTPGEGPSSIVGFHEGLRLTAERDFAAEVSLAKARLEALGIPQIAQGWQGDLDDPERALDLVAAVAKLVAEIQIDWYEEIPFRITRAANAGDLRLRVLDKHDWFGVEGEVTIGDDRAELAQLFDTVRRGGRYVHLGHGRYLSLSEELRARLLRASEVTHVGRGGLELGWAAAPAIADLADGAREATLSKSWIALRKRLDAAQLLDPEPAPALAAVLRPYQREGFRWLARLAAWGVGACLADDMGLGKTIQTLAVLAHRATLGPALVVAPTSVGFNWVREAARFAPGLRVVVYRDSDRDTVFESLGPNDLLIVSYGLLVQDRERFRKTHFASLVLDEAQALKNAATHRARAVRDLDAEWRVALTGTPLENHLGELWSLFRILSPGFLGSWEHFRERFAHPIEREKSVAARESLARVIAPFVLRRTKDRVAPELPSRTEIVVAVQLSPAEQKLYDAARLAAAARLQGVSKAASEGPDRFQVLAEITRLRQLACHPRLRDPESEVPSAKLERFLQIVDTLREEGHRALVFSQFVEHLSLVRAPLDARRIGYQYLDGASPPAEREKRVDAFQRGEGDLFLISLKAGGTGLNLTAANFVIHLDPWWNPAVEDQATDRAHRIGQQKPVTVYRLVASGTIEESILGLHDRKRDLVRSLLDGTDTAGKLSTQDLLALVQKGAN